MLELTRSPPQISCADRFRPPRWPTLDWCDTPRTTPSAPSCRLRAFAVVQDELFRRPVGRDRLLSRCREGVAGSTAIRGIVGALDRGIDSVLHEHGHRHLAVVRLPAPICGLEVIEGIGAVDCAIARPGALGPPWGMVVGWDGELHRLKRRKFRHDRVRDRRAKKSGWESVHYGWEDHEEPADMYDDLLVTWTRVLAG